MLGQKLSTEILAKSSIGPVGGAIFSYFTDLAPRLLKKNNDFRLIHQLSYPENASINLYIDKTACTVQYRKIDECARLIQKLGPGTKLSSSDLKYAFRLLSIAPCDFDLLGMTFQDKYYFDKCSLLQLLSVVKYSIKIVTFIHWVA